MMRFQHLSLILAGVFLNTLGQFCLKAGMVRIGTFSFKASNILPIGLEILQSPFIIAGVIFYLFSLVLWLLTLSRIDLSIAYPLLSIGYVFSLLIGHLYFNEPINLVKIAGIVTIMIGVYLVAQA